MSYFKPFTLLVFLALIAVPSPADQFDFEVLLNGKPIGHHQITLFIDETGRQVVQGNADYTVKLLGITFFAYEHQHREIWADNCLQSLSSTTKTNGDVERLTLTRNAQGYGITTLKETKAFGLDEHPCIWSYAYWRRDFTSQRLLMNGQTGQMSAVSFERLPPAAPSLQSLDPAAHCRRLKHPWEILAPATDWLIAIKPSLWTTALPVHGLDWRLILRPTECLPID